MHGKYVNVQFFNWSAVIQLAPALRLFAILPRSGETTVRSI